jgi:GntR family transcriptional regulator
VPLEPNVPDYRQIAQELGREIRSGTYPAGSTLPPEPELASRFGVGRATVNRAVSILRTEGLARVERGIGTVVCETRQIHRNASARYSVAARERSGNRGAFDSEIRALGMEPRSVAVVGRSAASPDVAIALQLDAGAMVVTRARQMYADDTPVQLATSYIPSVFADGTALAEQDSGPGGIISRFAELGLAQVRWTESIRVRRPDRDEAEFLRLEADQFVFEVWHTGWTAAGVPVELCVHVMPSHQWVLDYEIVP